MNEFTSDYILEQYVINNEWVRRCREVEETEEEEITEPEND